VTDFSIEPTWLVDLKEQLFFRCLKAERKGTRTNEYILVVQVDFDCTESRGKGELGSNLHGVIVVKSFFVSS
jgi:hypothetical protein